MEQSPTYLIVLLLFIVASFVPNDLCGVSSCFLGMLSLDIELHKKKTKWSPYSNRNSKDNLQDLLPIWYLAKNNKNAELKVWTQRLWE